MERMLLTLAGRSSCNFGGHDLEHSGLGNRSRGRDRGIPTLLGGTLDFELIQDHKNVMFLILSMLGL